MRQIYKLLLSLLFIVITAIAASSAIENSKNSQANATTSAANSAVVISSLNPGDRLNPGNSLQIGQYIISVSGQIKLILQGDGNLVLYDSSNKPLWATGTNGKAVSRAVVQTDGNFVLYDKNNIKLWSTNTAGHPGAFLIVQNDGNTVLYDTSLNQLWSTNTARPIQPYSAIFGCIDRDGKNISVGNPDEISNCTFNLPVTANVYVTSSGSLESNAITRLRIRLDDWDPDWGYILYGPGYTGFQISELYPKVTAGSHKISIKGGSENEGNIFNLDISIMVNQNGNIQTKSTG